MSDRPEKMEKIRVSVTLTRPKMDDLDHLVSTGLYLNQGEAIRFALGLLFRHHGLDPSSPPEEPYDEGGDEAGDRERATDLDV